MSDDYYEETGQVSVLWPDSIRATGAMRIALRLCDRPAGWTDGHWSSGTLRLRPRATDGGRWR